MDLERHREVTIALDDLMHYFEVGPVKVSAPSPVEDLLVLILVWQGVSYTRIGAILGISKQSVFKRIDRALTTAKDARKRIPRPLNHNHN